MKIIKRSYFIKKLSIMRYSKCKIKYVRTLTFFVKKLFNCFLRNGNRGLVDRLYYETAKRIKLSYKCTVKEFYHEVMLKIIPILGFQYQHIGRVKRGIPAVPRREKMLILGVKWLKRGINLRKERKLFDRFFNELSDIYKKSPSSICLKIKEEHYREVFKNKPLFRYMWLVNRKRKRRK